MEYVRHDGFKAVVSLVQAEGKPFNQDPRGGPWATVIKSDAEFARVYQNQEPERYLSLVGTHAQPVVRPRHGAGRRGPRTCCAWRCPR